MKMASSKVSQTLIKSLKNRTYSAAAAAQPKRSVPETSTKCSIKKLPNGVTVGVIPSNSPIARIGVVASAGSRFENGDNLGVSHLLRLSSKLRTENMSSLALTRTAQQIGGDITIMGNREYIYFKSAVTRNVAHKMMPLLQEMTTRQLFTPWDVSDIQKDEDGMLLDLALYRTRPHIHVVELLHSAAFRNTLGNSLYAAEHMVGNYTPQQVQEYVKANFSSGRMALIGIGIDQGQLEEMASQFEPHTSSNTPAEKSQFYGGGEIRDNCGGEVAYVAAGFAGPSLTSKDVLAAEVLRHMLGAGPHVKYSSGTIASSLTKATEEAVKAPCHVSCLNATYTDNGLFGFTAVAHASAIERVVQTAAKHIQGLASANISDEAVTRGKNQLKAEICMQFENPDVLLNWLGEQALSGEEAIAPEDVCSMVDAVTTADVKLVAKNIATSRPAMASTGNISRVPYLDKLFS